MTYGARIAVILSIVVVGFALDQWTKIWALNSLMGQAPTDYFGGMFRLIFATNKGAFLGLGDSLSPGQRFWLMTALNSVILVFVAGYLGLKRHIPSAVVVALALLLSGGLGNLYDRVFRGGEVIDFMNLSAPWFSIGGWTPRTGIFNIADLAIVAGLVLLVAAEFLGPKMEDEANKNEVSKEGVSE